MLSETEQKILELASKKHLVTKAEISALSAREPGAADTSIVKLSEMGYIDKLESLGTCFVITQKGIRATRGQV